MGDSAIRKQVFELRPEDLATTPIWEFALDEEGIPGQDEATVRPRPDLDHADPSEGLFVIRAEFVAADGSHFDGYVSPNHRFELGLIQPTIVTDAGQVGFWLGAFPPATGFLASAYATVDVAPAELFPLRFRSVVAHEGVRLEGQLDGFMHLESIEGDKVVVIT